MFAAALHFKCIFYGLIFCACFCECVCVSVSNSSSATCRPADLYVVFAAFLFLCTFLLRLLLNYAALSLHPTSQLRPVSVSRCLPRCVCVCLCPCTCFCGALLLLLTRNALCTPFPPCTALSAPFAHFCCCCHKNRIFIAFQFVIVYHTHTHTRRARV